MEKTLGSGTRNTPCRAVPTTESALIQPEFDTPVLLARPRGGFNDAMVQLERCRRYAARHGRIMVLDMSRSGLRTQLGDIFDLNPSFGCRVLPWRADTGAQLDRITSVFPAELAGRISVYEVEWDAEAKQNVDTETRVPTRFDRSRPYDEHLVVHEQAGGGIQGYLLLRRHLSLKPEVANEVVRRLIALGGDYDAVHIRNTDYRTDYETFLRNCRPMFAGRTVLICSDSKQVKDAAETILDQSRVIVASHTPETGGVPLFATDGLDPHQANIDMITDLLALAGAGVFAFTRLSGGNDNGVQYSGFSLLADLLNRDRRAVANLLRHADPNLHARLQILPRRQVGSSVTRRWHLLNQWRWNRGAKAKAARRNVLVHFRRFLTTLSRT